jgi:hypothetical protein
MTAGHKEFSKIKFSLLANNLRLLSFGKSQRNILSQVARIVNLFIYETERQAFRDNGGQKAAA